MIFGLPSLRIKGFYLAVATLAAQFFLVWMFNKVGWFYDYSPTGMITVRPIEFFGVLVTGPEAGSAAKYLFTLSIVIVMALAAKNIVRGRIGRAWMAICDMDIAAELIGIKPLMAKLTAFAVSSLYRRRRALYFSIYLGAVEPVEAFDINRSFYVLFIIIIGGLGSVLGSFLGAAFIVLVPILLKKRDGRRHGYGVRYGRPCRDIIDGSFDYLFPYRRAARVSPTVANRQGETAALAVPALGR